MPLKWYHLVEIEFFFITTLCCYWLYIFRLFHSNFLFFFSFFSLCFTFTKSKLFYVWLTKSVFVPKLPFPVIFFLFFVSQFEVISKIFFFFFFGWKYRKHLFWFSLNDYFFRSTEKLENFVNVKWSRTKYWLHHRSLQASCAFSRFYCFSSLLKKSPIWSIDFDVTFPFVKIREFFTQKNSMAWQSVGTWVQIEEKLLKKSVYSVCACDTSDFVLDMRRNNSSSKIGREVISRSSLFFCKENVISLLWTV